VDDTINIAAHINECRGPSHERRSHVEVPGMLLSNKMDVIADRHPSVMSEN
jgi:hypothetical protein